MNAVFLAVQSRSRRPDAMVVRRSLCHGAAEEFVANWPKPQPKFAVRSAHVCSVSGRPVLHGAMSARAACRRDRTRYCRQFEAAAADLMWWPCGGAVANEPGCSASRVGPHHNKVSTAQCARVLRGRSSDSARGDERAGRAPRGSSAIKPMVRSRSRRPVAVAVRLSLGQPIREESVASWPAPQPSPHRAVRTCASLAVVRFCTGR